MGTIPFSPQLVFGRVVRFQYTRYNQKTLGLQVWSLSLNTYFNLNKVNLFTLFKWTLLEVESFTSHQCFPSSPQPWFVLERRRMWLLHSVVHKYVAWHKKWELYEFEWLVNYRKKRSCKPFVLPTATGCSVNPQNIFCEISRTSTILNNQTIYFPDDIISANISSPSS